MCPLCAQCHGFSLGLYSFQGFFFFGRAYVLTFLWLSRTFSSNSFCVIFCMCYIQVIGQLGFTFAQRVGCDQVKWGNLRTQCNFVNRFCIIKSVSRHVLPCGQYKFHIAAAFAVLILSALSMLANNQIILNYLTLYHRGATS